MHATMPNSDRLVDDLVQQFFGVEPVAMAALAHDDAVATARYMPEDDPSTDPLDGLDVLVRRTVALALAMRERLGPVALVTERQATAAGWPSAVLANRAITFAWALFVATQPTSATPLLHEASEEAGAAMGALIRVGPALPDLDDLLAELHGQRQPSLDASGPTTAAHSVAPATPNAGIVSIEALLSDWFGVDAGAIDLPIDIFGTRVAGANARAVTAVKWLIGTAIELGSVIEREAVPAVRLKTERDAELAGEPGAAMANCALLLGVAIRHARHLSVRLLPPCEDLADAVVEAGRRTRARRLRDAGDREAMALNVLELQDLAARGYVHVGRANAREVAWRQIRDEA